MPRQRIKWNTGFARLVSLATGVALASCAAIKSPDAKIQSAGSGTLSSVAKVELSKYVGTWYEIGSYPHWFQRGCHCTRARYSQNADGTIRVVNSCNKNAVNGKYTVAEGTAVVQSDATDSNARLKVYFFLPWLRLFGGDYWIIGLDPNYQWAVVGEPSKNYLWILSRNPTLPEADLEKAKQAITSNGLDLSRIVWAKQDGCTYPE
jgi:apolipoprotein D and lipocalin family protein